MTKLVETDAFDKACQHNGRGKSSPLRWWGEHRTKIALIKSNLPAEQFPSERIASATLTNFEGGKQHAKSGIKGVNESWT